MEATESCRSGLEAGFPMSVCDRLNVDGFDITECMVSREVSEDESQENSLASSRDTCCAPSAKL